MTQVSERFRAVDVDHVAALVMNHEEDVTFLLSLALEKVVLFLRSISSQGKNLKSLVDLVVTVMILVQEPSLMATHSSSEVLNAIQRVRVVLPNQIVVYSSPDVLKTTAREIVSVIILALINEGALDQFL